MKYLFLCVIVGATVLPAVSFAQFTDQFTVEAEVTAEVTTSTSTPGSSGGGTSSGTRIDREVTEEFVSEIPNVRTIRITKAGESISVTWDNPAIDFSVIKVIAGDFFAKDPYDGWLAYNASGNQFSAALPGKEGVFYTFFVVMPDGRWSSGISTFYANIPEELPLQLPTTPEPSIPTVPTAPATTAPETPLTSSTPITVDGIVLFGTQRGVSKQSVLTDETIMSSQFTSIEDIVFSIPIASVPPELQTIVITIENKETGMIEQFLMQKDATQFFAKVPRRLVAGEYTVQIQFYDFSEINRATLSRTVDIYPHYFVLTGNGVTQDGGAVLVFDYIIIVYGIFALLLLLLFVRVWWLVRYKERPAAEFSSIAYDKGIPVNKR